MGQAQELEPTRCWTDISLVLMDDESITEVNASHLNKREPTDVISFTYEPMPGADEGYSGEVIVNVQRAQEEGAARGSASRELALYIAHGCLHLTGANDDTEKAREAMAIQQDIWLTDADKLGLLHGLVEADENASS